MADRLDTIATERNLTFGQVCTILAKRGLNFEVRKSPNLHIKITGIWKQEFQLKKEILDEEMISYSTGEDTGSYFILIHAEVD